MAKVGRQGMAKEGRCRQTQPADGMAGTGLEAKTPADDPTGTGLAVNSRQTIRPAQALQQQPADEVAGTGLAVKQPADEVAGTGLAANNQPMKLASLCLEMEVGGGSAVVLATRKAGSDLPYCLPPNLSPLPVSVHTHSLNLQKPI